MEKLFRKLVKFTRSYIEENNIKSMVLGISGGIDSTVVALICHEVSKQLPDVSFIGVSLPSKTNEDSENDISKTLGSILCDKFIVHSIEPEYAAVRDSFNTSLEDQMNSLQLGNIKARLRMVFLYNLASMYKGVVMDTDNLTEHYLGFWTIHGDVGDLNPIGSLWKMEVYELASYLAGIQSDSVLQTAILKSIGAVPTDGNGVKSGGDLAQIAPGLTYKEVDEVLQYYFKSQKLLGKYDKELEEGIIRRYKNSMYKRKTLPIKPY